MSRLGRASQHFFDRGQPLGHLHRAGQAQRAHAVLHRLPPQCGGIERRVHAIARCIRHDQQLVEADAAAVAGVPAFQAAHRLVRPHPAGQPPGFGQIVQRLARGALITLLAGRAQHARQALGQHADHGGRNQVGRHAQVGQPRDGRGRVVGVQRAEHQVAGQRRLDRHLGGGQIADLADHDDVRVLAHQRAQAFGEAHVDGRMHLRLVEGRLDHLDRVFDGADVDLVGGQLLERGVQRRRLARAGRPGDQDDAVRPRDQLLPALGIVGAETQRLDVLHRRLGVEDAHHQLLAKSRGQGGQAHFHLGADLVHRVRALGLDAPVERAAAFDHVHAAEQLDARGHRVHHAQRHLVDGVQHAVDAKADGAHVAARFQVDIAGALVEGVLPQPVDHLHDTLVVGIQLLGGLAQFHQLLEAGRRRDLAALLRGAHRLGQRIELGRVLAHVLRVGEHQLDAAPRVRLDLRHPADVEGLAGRDDDLGLRQLAPAAHSGFRRSAPT